MKNTILMVMFSSILIYANNAHAEFFDFHPLPTVSKAMLKEDPTKEDPKKKDEQDKLQLLQQANLSFTSSVPKVKVNVLKYYLGISHDKWIPFYIFSTQAAQTEVTLENTVDSLLDPVGGVLNLSLGLDEKYTPFGLFDFESEYEGFFVYLNCGAKIIEGLSENTTESELFVTGNINAEAKIILPLGDEPISATKRVGALQFSLSLHGNYVSSGNYNNLFTEEPDSEFIYANSSFSFYIKNQMYISAGGTIYSSEDQIDKRSFISLSLTQ
jgi:hypothetical protein